AVRHNCGHPCDVAHLRGQVAGHEVDAVGQILPGSADAFDDSLPTQLAFGADFARHAGDFGSEGVELIDHGVDGVFEVEDFPADVKNTINTKIGRAHV